ncbi:MAG: aldehyde dehydrogenase family protein, partial [Rhodanobacteraceae bacterium]
MAFFDASLWDGKLYSDGWNVGAGGKHAIFEPATGRDIGYFGVATAADVKRAAERAAKAQPAWAALPYEQRAAILRRGGELVEKHADTLAYWLEREAGSAKGKA